MGAGPEEGIPTVRGRSPRGLPGSPWRGRRAFPATAGSHLRLLRNMKGWRPRPPGPRARALRPSGRPSGWVRGLLPRWRGGLLEGLGAAQRPPAAGASSVPLGPPHLQSTDTKQRRVTDAQTPSISSAGGAPTAAAGGRGAWRGPSRPVRYSLAGKLLITKTPAGCPLRGQCWSFAGVRYNYLLSNKPIKIAFCVSRISCKVFS